jgi:flagellar hook-associated protein FlgK
MKIDKDDKENLKIDLIKITKEISISENVYSKTANDLRDKKDIIEKELSEIGKFQSYDNDTGYVFEFSEKGGTLQGLNTRITILNGLKEQFNIVFNGLETTVDSFIEGGMKEPNKLLEWHYENETNFSDYFSNISINSESLKNSYDFTNTVLNDLENEKNSVNLDEEMMNMIQYQRAYEAAAKVIQTADEMLKSLLDMKS